ncbi:MAG: Lrp/AsnC family transcriptional regulator [Gemmatimonadota bacterium]
MPGAMDLTILRLLQENARITNAEIARRVGIAASAVSQRVRKLEQQRIIIGYHASVCPDTLEQGLLAFITVRTAEGAQPGEAAAALAAIPQVLELHRVVGDDCFLLKVRARDTESLGALIEDRIHTLPQVSATRTTIVLRTEKDAPGPVLSRTGSEGSSVAEGSVAS